MFSLWCFVVRGNLLYVLPCAILFLCFSVLLALRLPRLGKRRLILVLFVRLIDLCLFGLFPLPLDVWERLRFVIVALPGLFSYFFCFCNVSLMSKRTLHEPNTYLLFYDATKLRARFRSGKTALNLVMLNEFRCHAHF